MKLGIRPEGPGLPLAAMALLLAPAFLTPATSTGQDAAPSRPTQVLREFSLPGRATVELAGDWVARREAEPPPPELLVPSAPPIRFTEALVIESRGLPAVVVLAASENPYVGYTPARLDVELLSAPRPGRGLLDHLFYFFFPPPSACLAEGRAAFDRAERREDERRLRDADPDRPLPPRSPVRVRQPCRFSAAPREFFAGQLSPALVLRSVRFGMEVRGEFGEFHRPNIETLELGDYTFFLFEAEAARLIGREEIERFGLDDARQGEQAHFFWAVGARTPFPFVADPQRKDIELLHVAYAVLAPRGRGRERFRALLESIRFGN